MSAQFGSFELEERAAGTSWEKISADAARKGCGVGEQRNSGSSRLAQTKEERRRA
ncbi:hypothetical protein [Streptomyces goshikiensis]|uniref:hypothetical protein n=1 Tax=Streptomyces goshikiensis TaxID=1942 RepID=UPI0036DA4C41